MRRFFGDRGSGKTTRAIEAAYWTGAAIIVPCMGQKRTVAEAAKKYLEEKYGKGQGDVQVFYIGEIERVKPIRNVVIDEASWCLRQLLESRYGMNVLLTTDGPNEIPDFLGKGK